MTITLFDPGLANRQGAHSANLGDLIIQEAVQREFNNIFNSNLNISRISTHEFPNSQEITSLRHSKFIFVGGTNLLGSDLDVRRQWKLTLTQMVRVRRAILLGVGWKYYQPKPNFYSRIALKAVLSSRWMHSVRDSFSQRQLEKSGIKNVINTGCPTMWPFLSFDMNQLPTDKADTVLLTLTDYRRDPDLDRIFIETVAGSYKSIYFWPQGAEDLSYFRSLTESITLPVKVLERSYQAYVDFLQNHSESFDYIGTRLHGGIKSLLSKRRSLIIEIDNRATEIAKDTQLPTVKRDDFTGMSQWIKGSSTPAIKLNEANITRWRSQFQADFQTSTQLTSWQQQSSSINL